MSNSSKAEKMRWVVLVVMALALLVGRAMAAIRCGEAVSKVLPCQGFLVSGVTAPSAACCGAVQSLEKMERASSGDRQAICKCFKGLYRAFPVNITKAQLIPQLCNVTIAIAVTPDIDCDRI
ncbi:non-specific lipid-transfer protein 1-like [Salvia miltiorrhiza]|uniref:non-specific lipid-transfer protein 1-like n=1 Tax=Salvia miltiorrhiza TaxID=226208 RepID=UPI0025AD3C48|nr:non-specific lipid-transfer protein 1-like [Salvia miltiorrhiza]